MAKVMALIGAVLYVVMPPLTKPPTAPEELAIWLVGVLALAAYGWLVLALAVTAAGRLPGQAGRIGRMLQRAVVPAAIRPLLATALAAGLTVTPLSVAAAGAPHDPHETTDQSGVSASSPVRAPVSPVMDRQPWVVRPGDTLWAIAAAHLGGRPRPAAIAAEWPRWWAANRRVIGADPDLIVPGQRLTPPRSGRTG
jgi:hypothetical protein